MSEGEKCRMDEEKKKLLVDLCIQLTPWAAKERGENKLPVWAELASKVHPNCSFMTAQNTFKKLMEQEKIRREKATTTGRANEDISDMAISDLENSVGLAYDIYAEFLSKTEEESLSKRKLENEKKEEVKAIKKIALDRFQLNFVENDEGECELPTLLTPSSSSSVKNRKPSSSRNDEVLSFLKELAEKEEILRTKENELRAKREKEFLEKQQQQHEEKMDIMRKFLEKF